MKQLDETLREQWQRNGYVLLRQHLTPTEWTQLERWVDGAHHGLHDGLERGQVLRRAVWQTEPPCLVNRR